MCRRWRLGHKNNDIILNEENEFFDVESEGLSIEDQHIQVDLLNEMRKYINWVMMKKLMRI